MTRKSKSILAIVIVMVICIGGFIADGLYRHNFSPEAISGHKDVYAGLLSSEINRRWDCTPEAKREDFVLALMQRFTPEDKKILTSGRQRQQELQRKQEAGEITVAERDELKSGKLVYTPPPTDFWGKEAERLAKIKKQDEEFNLYGPPVTSSPSPAVTEVFTGDNFSPTTCSGSDCNAPRVSVWLNGQNLQVTYEDRLTRWTLPRAAIEAEYERLTWGERADAIQAMKLNEALIALDLQEQAEQAVAALPASDVPVGTEAARIELEHKRLICAKFGM